MIEPCPQDMNKEEELPLYWTGCWVNCSSSHYYYDMGREGGMYGVRCLPSIEVIFVYIPLATEVKESVECYIRSRPSVDQQLLWPGEGGIPSW